MTTQQVNSFIKHKIGLLFQELSIESGLEINYSNANLDHIATSIAEYMLLGQVPNIADDFPIEESMEAVDEYE
jgi:hypothetical protein